MNSVLEQQFDDADFEVIVVNDSGRPLPEEPWQQSPRVQVIHTCRRERSVARNTGAAVARGRYLHFLDDDDLLATGALAHFWMLAQGEEAAWLYGSSKLVESDGRPLLQLHHQLPANCFVQVMAGEWIPLQASLIHQAVFFDNGGFDPLLAGPEDIDLLRRIALRHELLGSDAVVAFIVRGAAGSTTDYDRHPEQSRLAREKLFSQPGVFRRLRASATNPYWAGRIVRAYLTSLVWNVPRRNFLLAGSRAAHALAALALAGPRLLTLPFWQAVLRAYESETFRRGRDEQPAALLSDSRHP